MASIHEGHRGRLKRRFLRDGLDGFEPHEALELLLYYGIPQGDTNPLAHRLLDRFGSLEAVLMAPVHELTKVTGVGEHTAVLLHLIAPFMRKCQGPQPGALLDTSVHALIHASGLFYGRTRETFFLLSLDSRTRLIDADLMAEGNATSATVSVRAVTERALSRGAAQVILAHNHPGGIAMPTYEDRFLTRKIATSLALVEIPVLDHLIFGIDESQYSFRQSNLMEEVYEEVALRVNQDLTPYRKA